MSSPKESDLREHGAEETTYQGPGLSGDGSDHVIGETFLLG